jgi:hypothetical protein
VSEPSGNDELRSFGAIRNSVENLLYSYAARADELDHAGIAELLSSARLTAHNGVELEGAEQIDDHLRGLFATAERSRHMITNVRVTVADDRRTATTECLYNKWVIGDEPAVDAAGRYRSGFRLTESGWTFAWHEIMPQWRRGIGRLS